MNKPTQRHAPRRPAADDQQPLLEAGELGNRDVGRLACSASSAALLPFGRRHVGERRVLAQLQRADVGDDRPAIARPDLRGVVGHRAEAVGDHVEEMADRRARAADRRWNDGGRR